MDYALVKALFGVNMWLIVKRSASMFGDIFLPNKRGVEFSLSSISFWVTSRDKQGTNLKRGVGVRAG